jgi:DNA invertase Pin-like site-specific DNA recombinase
MKYGYTRVSTDDQNPALQHAALQLVKSTGQRRSKEPFATITANQ